MKKIICLFTIFSSLIFVMYCSVITSFAVDFTVCSTQNIYDYSEIDEVLEAIENDSFIKKSTTAYQASEGTVTAYKLYSLSPDEFSAENIADAVNDTINLGNYKWIVPDNNKQIIKVGREQDKWEVLGYSTFENNDESAEFLLGNFAKNILKTSNVSARTSSDTVCVCFEIPQYHTYFAGVFSDDESYVIPYGSRPDLTGLENGKKYSVENANEILTACFANALSDNEIDGGGTGDNDEKSVTLAASVITALFMITLAIISVIRKSRKQ